MKGYTNVSVVDIKSAMLGWKNMINEGERLRDVGIELYYDKYYTNGSWLTKFFNKKYTPYDFVKLNIPMFNSWAFVLKNVLSKEEVELVHSWCWSRWSEEYAAVKSLVNASEEGDILLDNELCRFVNKFKEVKDD